MRSRSRQRTLSFSVLDGHMVRTVSFPDGRPAYTHRCTLDAYQRTAYALEATPAEGEGCSLETIADAEDVPHTQVNIALEFLKERGIVEVRHRRCYPASDAVHLDAMIEWHALAEKPAGKD